MITEPLTKQDEITIVTALIVLCKQYENVRTADARTVISELKQALAKIDVTR